MSMWSEQFDFLRPPKSPTIPDARSLVFLDSRDLINCFEKQRPIGAQELGDVFRRVGARLIVTFTTICELMPGSEVPVASEVERGFELARMLDLVPHGFIRNSTIVQREFREAYRAWQNDQKKSVCKVDPFVNRFYKTLWKPATGTTDLLIEDEETKMLDRMSAWDQVRILAMDPKSLRWDSKYTDRMVKAIAEDRETYGSKRGTKSAREGAVKRQLIAGGMSEPTGGLPKFAKWLHQNPDICPGWRIGWDAWEEYRSNLMAPVDPGDLRDFSHIAVIPYVTHFTTDAKWRDVICERALKRRVKDKLPAPYFDRVFSNLEEILTSLEVSTGS